jgi:hypothetical protein
MKKNKESLNKEARELNVKVNCWVNGSSCNVLKELTVSCLLEKIIFALYPTPAVEAGIKSPKQVELASTISFF